MWLVWRDMMRSLVSQHWKLVQLSLMLGTGRCISRNGMLPLTVQSPANPQKGQITRNEARNEELERMATLARMVVILIGRFRNWFRLIRNWLVPWQRWPERPLLWLRSPQHHQLRFRQTFVRTAMPNITGPSCLRSSTIY